MCKECCSSNWFKRCEFCTSEEALLLTHLPFNEVIEEDELHILITCPKYHQQRLNLQEGTKSLLLRNEAHEELYSCEHIRIFGPYVKKLFKLRFPRKKRWRSRQAAGHLSWPQPENLNCFEHLQFIECWLMILSDEKFDHKSWINLTSQWFKCADFLSFLSSFASLTS